VTGPIKYRIIDGYVGKYGDFHDYAVQKKYFWGWETVYTTNHEDRPEAYVRNAVGSPETLKEYNAKGEVMEGFQPQPTSPWLPFVAGIGCGMWVTALVVGVWLYRWNFLGGT
jgi:hypothetical protein